MSVTDELLCFEGALCIFWWWNYQICCALPLNYPPQPQKRSKGGDERSMQTEIQSDSHTHAHAQPPPALRDAVHIPPNCLFQAEADCGKLYPLHFFSWTLLVFFVLVFLCVCLHTSRDQILRLLLNELLTLGACTKCTFHMQAGVYVCLLKICLKVGGGRNVRIQVSWNLLKCLAF